MGRRPELLPFERLHAYAAGELEPAEHAEVEAALESDPGNRARLEKVRAMRGLLADTAPVEPNDLTWKRLQQRVHAELSRPTPERERRGGVWMPIGIAAAAVIATLVLLDHKTATVEHPNAGPQVLASGSAPLDVTLASGASLHLSESSEVTVRSPAARPLELQLQVGQLDVHSPEPSYDGGAAVMVRTPAYVAAASSKDFSVGYQADSYFVEARDGEVAVRGRGFVEGTVVKAGERRTVQARAAKKRAPVEPISKAKPAAKPADRPVRRPPPPDVRESTEGQTSVQVVLEEADPVKRDWLQAALAYYERRDLPAAIDLARKVVAEAPDRAEGRMAEVLLCEALIATQRANEAIEACEARLKRPQSDEEKRQIHFLLATIHHTQLGDCARAIPHYGQAMVFGGTSLFDDRVRLFRASCALELHQLDLAASDLESVKSRSGRLPNPEELARLLKRLDEARGEGRGK